MSEMIERVARALTIQEGSDPDGETIIADRPKRWMLVIEDARAAIEAMREPTEAMIEECSDAYGRGHQRNFVADWQAGVDAALR